eukprot:6187245-Pleurochrysis_carterae.AAC.1
MGSAFSAADDAAEVPAFMRCDGHFAPVAEGEHATEPASRGVAAWCGFLRCDGHGTCVIKRSEEHVESVQGKWTVLDETKVRITLPERGNLPRNLVMMAGEQVDTILLSVPGDNGEVSSIQDLYAFVPEEEE